MAKSFALALRIVAQLRSHVTHWLSANGRSVREMIGTMVKVTSSSTGICIHLNTGKRVNWVLASAQADKVVEMMSEPANAESLTSDKIRAILENCKTENRYVIDTEGKRFWVFGKTMDCLLVRRIVDGIMRPLTSLNYNQVARVE